MQEAEGLLALLLTGYLVEFSIIVAWTLGAFNARSIIHDHSFRTLASHLTATISWSCADCGRGLSHVVAGLVAKTFGVFKWLGAVFKIFRNTPL